MKKELMDMLCCPMCKAELTLSSEKEETDEVIKGTLTCTKCKEVYLIEEGIPNLLPKEKK
jgi:uncharacterized protein